jgi:hypothetical protein
MNGIAAVRKFFRDVNPDKLDFGRDSNYIIGRLLETGDVAAVRWMLATFDHDSIRRVLKTKRALSRRSAVFWRHFFSIPENEIICLQKSSPSMPIALWPH